jgi:hypothetical protein
MRKSERNYMHRDEYLTRAREFALRGQDLPQAALLDLEVIEIRRAHNQRQELLEFIREELSNKALAEKFKEHVRTIEKIVQRETWSHLI